MTDIASVRVASRERPEADHLVVGCFEGEAPDVSGLASGVREAVGRLSGRTGFRGKDEQLAQTDVGPEGPVVSLLGMGAKKDLTYAKLSRWIGRLAEDARVSGARRLALVVPPHAETTGRAADRVLRGLALSVYRYDRWQTDGEKGNRLESVAVVPPSGEEAAYRESLARSQPVAEAVAFVRNLANGPANVASPAWMEERARELAESRGLKITVLQTDELEKRGMGGLLAVGAGSAVPPRLVRIDVGTEGPAIALVGKGVTFDTGGISIKPATDMDEMKYDKGGACTVLGVAQAVADLNLPVRLRVYVPLAENMLGSRAYRPSDIVRCYNGKTVEITNTDCEGRMILADALAWAAEEEPEAILEFSTLTGACIVALGFHAGGLFTPDDELASELLAAASSAGERLWRLPLFPEFLEEMKGMHADLKNCSGRWGGASTAAAFLSQFVGEIKHWAHMDIAGVANVKSDPCPGATGFGVALTVDWLLRRLG
ncbi:MAG TPA: leucyl aminopeptidase [Thermoanaerobaculia bacterium]|nr:leucyl aminopeptidase [Thermoanaerobaculia bacterium]